MTSMLTNTAALGALKTLRSIENNMSKTQDSISTGMRVGVAADNAAYWSIATTMRSDNKSLSTVQDALGLAAAKADTAYSAMDNAISVISEIKAKLVASREPGVDKDKINKELTELKNQLRSISESASFSGENWLFNSSTGAPGTKEMVASFIRAADGSVSIKTLAFDSSQSTLVDTANEQRGLLTRDTTVTRTVNGTATTFSFYLMEGGVSGTGTSGAAGTLIAIDTNTSDQTIEDMVAAVDQMHKSMVDTAATLGAISKRIDLQKEFVTKLGEVIDTGIGRLVDADMNQESTRLKALQTQQQLGIQALSIANTASQNLLTLFRQ